MTNFQSQFKGLPGDTRALGCTDYGQGDRCQNDLLEAPTLNNNDCITVTELYTGEPAHFWADLQKTGFAKEKVHLQILLLIILKYQVIT